MHNISVTPNLPNAALSQTSKGAGKIDSQSPSNFFEIASENLMKLAPSQTFMVPGSNNDESISFWKDKLEVEEGIPDLEECIEEKVGDLISQIAELLNSEDEE
ncbi:MAG: hypothetical protein HQ596_02595 [Candidatus Saganbacteria bacterium]|nr:hypothetical protein [Candidatus Saganbacteria bacterium]